MVRYSVTLFRSRGGPGTAAGGGAPGSSATRERCLTSSSHRAPVHRSLAGSFAMHAAVLAGLLSLARSETLPIAPEPASVAMVFQAAPAAASPVLPSPPPAAAPPTVEVPSPPPTPEPLQPQRPPPPPLPMPPPQSQ